ncbi:MAG TPA: autotransporter-associated beta strand repeat-containing protein, partial [Devosia sp.]|nr:autotransporter-associated beta strand repeat-containing protein [Devosia sp.]
AGQDIQFWDGADLLGNSAIDGGSGAWTGTNSNWTDLSGTINNGWHDGVGVFQGAPGAVTVAGPLGFQGLQFKKNGYLVTGSSHALTGDSAPGGNADASFITVDGSVEVTIASDLTGLGLDKVVGGGTLVLSGDNSYAGQTRISTGTLMTKSATALGNGSNTTVVDTSGILDLGGFTLVQGAVHLSDSGTIQNGTLHVATDFTQSGGVMSADAITPIYRLIGGTVSGTVTAATLFDLRDGLVSGDLAGNAQLVKSNAGTVVLQGANSYTGGTRVDAGTLIGDAAAIRGDISNDGIVVFNQSGDAAFAGDIGGSGGMVKAGLGALTLSGSSALDWTIATGTLASTAERFGGNAAIAAGATLNFDQASDASYAGTISGGGSFFKQGPARLVMTGDSSGFGGATTVSDGTLAVDGTLGGTLAVLAGAHLEGVGTVGTTNIASNATLAPAGNATGTMTVDGDLTFEAGSRFAVAVNATGGDLVKVTGTAVLDGGSVIQAAASGSAFDVHSRHTILSAGNLTGAFAGVTSDFAFLTPSLIHDYAAGTVGLVLSRNGRDFAAMARTPNQIATAKGIESIGFDAHNPVYDAIAQLPDHEDLIRASFDALSGEIHGSIQTGLIEDSSFVRDAANDRMRAAFAGVAASVTPILAYAPGATPLLVPPDAGGPALWSHAFGAWGTTDSDGNAAGFDRSTGGMLIGADSLIGDWRIGLLAGYSHS